MTLPNGSGPFPAVVLVHGSGPNDRDESIGGTKIFRDLAQGLASRGIAVLRYEKRTKVYPAESAKKDKFTANDETVDDAVRAVALLRNEPKIAPARVFLVAHSLGGYLAPRIALRDPQLAGLVTLAGSVRPLEELVADQLRHLNRPAAEAQAILGSLSPAYVSDLKGYNPAVEAKKLKCRILVLQGERDYQVTMKDFDLWKASLFAQSNFRSRTFPLLNHFFVEGAGVSMPAEYERLGHVSPAVISAIGTWIQTGEM